MSDLTEILSPSSTSLSDDCFSHENVFSDGEESTSNEGELSEEQLRELYDSEEIDRFLNLFSAFVTEVQLPDTPVDTGALDPSLTNDDEIKSTARSEDGDWTATRSTSLSGEYFSPTAMTFHSTRAKYDSLSEAVACTYLAPILPHPRPSPPPFTIGRLRLATQRLYLAALPVYGPFFARLLSLATWEDDATSFFYCSIFWILWWYNLLPSALFLRILASLLKRRLFPYPTLDDLRRHREEVMRADDFGQQVSSRLSASSGGITEMWRLFKLFDQSRKKKLKNKVKEKAKGKDNDLDPTNASQDNDPTILDDADDSEETKDMKRIGLRILEDIADLHERTRNIFIWRRPSSSRKYGFILTAIFLITLLPTQYVVKLSLFIIGFSFWHITPVIASLPPSEMNRLPAPLCDVYTDAEYAMDLISRRVAQGLQVEPSSRPKRSKKQKPSDPTPENISKPSHSPDSSIDWKKWGDRVALGKGTLNDIKRLRTGKTSQVEDDGPSRYPTISDTTDIVQSQSSAQACTFPCQHTSSPGIITLTEKLLLFTPLMSQHAKLVIQLAAVKGVKKAGLLKGLRIRWNDTSGGNNEQREENFMWVGGRDEVFARLVASEGKRWMKV